MRESSPLTVGLVDLRDLVYARPWERAHARELASALGLQPGWQTWTQLAPCDAMLVVTARGHALPLAAWWGGARRVVVAVDVRGEPADLEPEVRALEDAELERAIGARPTLVWDGSPASVAALRAALADLAAPGPAPRPDVGERSPAAQPRAGDLLSSTWTEVALGFAASRVASRLFADATGAVRVHTSVNDDVALTSDGTLGLSRTDGELRLVDAAGASSASAGSRAGLPFALDVEHGLAAAGWRCTFTWYGVRRARESGALALHVLCSCAHDWPVGHAKKLYGYDDNQPRALAIAPDGGAYVSTFDRDAIVAGALPFRWRAHTGVDGAQVAAVEWPHDDALRRLFFIPDWEMARAHAAAPGDAAPVSPAVLAREEDARGRAPVVVVGPDDAHRYALALDQEVWTVRRDDVAERIGGPDEGYAVFDAAHQIVRRGSGRLLGGDASHLLVLHGGALAREELRGGARTPVGEEAGEVDHAAAIGGRFVLVRPVEGDREGRVALRVVG